MPFYSKVHTSARTAERKGIERSTPRARSHSVKKRKARIRKPLIERNTRAMGVARRAISRDCKEEIAITKRAMTAGI
jgi:hypothetical protein